MRVLLVGPDLEANLSLLYLASSLRAAGHEPVIAPFNCRDDAPSVLRAARDADLVGLSMCFQVRALEFLALADALKARRARPARSSPAATTPPAPRTSCSSTTPRSTSSSSTRASTRSSSSRRWARALVARAGEVPGVAFRRDGRAASSRRPAPIREELDSLPAPGPLRARRGCSAASRPPT